MYYVSYDVYYDNCFVHQRIVRFKNQKHFENCIEVWKGKDYYIGWSFRNTKEVTKKQWMAEKESANNFDLSERYLWLLQ